MINLSAPPTLSIWKEDAQVLQHGDNLNITGWRNVGGKPDYFCDFITITIPNANVWEFRCYEATTRPGLPYLFKPLSPKGTAILVPDYYDKAFQLGLHRGLPALVQCAPLTVYRDNDRDAAFDEDIATIDTGMFGIDIHRAGFLSLLVDTWSAGCQVFRKADEFEEFIDFCKKSNQQKFSYNLVEFTYGL